MRPIRLDFDNFQKNPSIGAAKRADSCHFSVLCRVWRDDLDTGVKPSQCIHGSAKSSISPEFSDLR